MFLVIALTVVLVIWSVSVYNRLVSSRNQVKNAFGQIDVQLNRRYDLIPNLVETAKAYMKHERETLEAVIDARNKALQCIKTLAADPLNAQKIQQLNQLDQILSRSMGQFFALAEKYPDLKANTTMSQLMEELVSTENKVAFARQGYNDTVTHYNTLIEKFPNSLLAQIFGFEPSQWLTISEDKMREPVKVQF